MRPATVLIAVVLAASGHAQLFAPVRPFFDRQQHPVRLTFMFTTIDTNVVGEPLRTGGALEGDFAVGKSLGLGFWGVSDEAESGGKLEWFEAHAVLYVLQTSKHVLGVSLGLFGVTEEGGENSKWSELKLVGSSVLDSEGKWTVGYSLGHLNNQDTFGGGGSGLPGAASGSDGTSYGVNIDYRISDAWSLGASWWTMDIDNGTKIDRSALGASFRF